MRDYSILSLNMFLKCVNIPKYSYPEYGKVLNKPKAKSRQGFSKICRDTYSKNRL